MTPVLLNLIFFKYIFLFILCTEAYHLYVFDKCFANMCCVQSITKNIAKM